MNILDQFSEAPLYQSMERRGSLEDPQPTNYTAVYVTFESHKLRGQFSENLVLQIYEFLFNSGGKISTEKRIMKVLRIKD